MSLRRGLFLVVDAGVSSNWIDSVEGPTGVELVKAAADTAIDASVGAGFTAFDRTMGDWQNSLIRWRCVSSRPRQVWRAGCGDLKFFVGRLGFDQLDPGALAALNATRFRLPAEQVDSVIAAGRDVLRGNPACAPSPHVTIPDEHHAGRHIPTDQITIMTESHHFRHRFHVDAEGLQEFRRSSVEADGKLQFDQGARGRFAAMALKVASVGRCCLTISSAKAASRCTSSKHVADCQLSNAAFCSSVTPTFLPMRLCAATS